MASRRRVSGGQVTGLFMMVRTGCARTPRLMSRRGVKGAQFVRDDAVQAVEQGRVVALKLLQRVSGQAQDDAIADGSDGRTERGAVDIVGQRQEVALVHFAMKAGGSFLAHDAVVQNVNDATERFALAKQHRSGLNAEGVRRCHQHLKRLAVQVLEAAGLCQCRHRGGTSGDRKGSFGFCVDEEIGHGGRRKVFDSLE